MKVRKKPVVVEAHQWWRNGDHPEDGSAYHEDGALTGQESEYEGQVVRRYRHPDMDGNENCTKCWELMHAHGWIDTLEGGHVVCPGDFIITGVQGERYPCKPDVFWRTYERVEAEAT